MDITSTITESKNHIKELVTVEEWMHGRDTYIMLVPEHADTIFLKVIDGYLVLEYKELNGTPHSAKLRKLRESVSDAYSLG